MAHFNLESELSRVLKLDAPITKGPTARWERKASDSMNSSVVSNKTPFTPGENLNKSKGKTPVQSKTPTSTNTGKNTKNLLSGGKKKTPKTPNGGDRFIANRATTQFELGYYKLTQPDKENSDDLTPNKKEYQRAMSENLNGRDIKAANILHYNGIRAPLAPEGHLNNLRVLYSQSKTPGSVKKSTRHIPNAPERVLDAPEIIDDYYLNLLDWNSRNILALCLSSNVYLWNASNGDIQQLLTLEGSVDYVSSISWMREATHVAVGTSLGEVQIWDVNTLQRVRNMTGHAARVGSLSWNSYIVSSGCRSGVIHHHDVRAAEHQVAMSSNHTQEVCGLRWSPDGRFLASGGNDNLLNIWSSTMNQRHSEDSPLYTFSQHQAAVKALGWCPWQNSILASGGGTADRSICFWNVNTGVCLERIDTKSQVCGILWSKNYKEIISGHGFANNQLIIWKYPTMQRIAELTGHSARVLHMAMSPDGSCIASAAADETLRLWQCFPIDITQKTTTKSIPQSKSILKQGIR